MTDGNRQNKVVLDAPHRFVDVSSGILRTVTADIGKQTQRISMEFAVSMDGLENSTAEQLNTLSKLLESTSKQLETTKQDMDENIGSLRECASLTKEEATPCLRVLAEEAEGVLKSMSSADELAKRKHAQLVEQMDHRNEMFEQKLRKDHDEFSRMHARRLANVLQYQF
ncbi:hypothetical protein IW140_005084 [Coemansia sp. RSA 1813]|nr:hypothetical protein EV178_005107 [Coemansia sp. RSA 1646]KAJ1771196.1 hypothetical protein LPJ74_002587 [Coemansia sp. RSA 1843]KAJ2089067.1 hypothetical protein IW138_003779 [Coemansia sp. RSA 986]KAJ2212029.1 hypothetical protein EV179_005015 [Coemansia sp. RSA 487]KAJ2566042.1 hypothetical protein IW140_005084 [Coemansia sp. RSA 1813]